MKSALKYFTDTLESIERDGLTKNEKVITTPQGVKVGVSDGRTLVNMCANNYLGLANNPDVIAAAKKSYDEYGYGMSSVRFICGTQELHKKLERKVSEFLGTEDTILYSSCFDANGGLFETLLGPEDAIISDELNHASIIDGVRLCKANRFRYKNNNMEDLRAKLEEAKNCRIKLIATDGVFSMDGIVADLKSICDLADEYDALVMVDDSHASGFMGKTGRGTSQHCGVEGRVDIITGTFGKALGGASGGFTSGRKAIIDLLRQRSRPYLFSNTLAPAVAAGSIKVLELIENDTSRRDKLFENTRLFAEKIKEIGFDVIDGGTPIIPIMLYDEHKAVEVAKRMMEKGVYVVAFSYPVVPKGRARIRTQLSAALSTEDILYIVDCFRQVKEEMGE
ncbi:MAG: glycine C-acetyltransferase [Clostridia bacterium]|nr:glycine C-acetyltransferase [Clostridia bacterium]MBQ7224702.1 glycine C-acetyltransferase [Clostridia bacterium]MBR7140775.1 glycine C-acetyltransferase [Clostridia bacterium]